MTNIPLIKSILADAQKAQALTRGVERAYINAVVRGLGDLLHDAESALAHDSVGTNASPQNDETNPLEA